MKEEMYLKTVPQLGIALSCKRKLEEVNETLDCAIIHLLEFATIDLLNHINKSRHTIYHQGIEQVISYLELKGDKAYVYLGFMDEMFEVSELPEQAKLKLIELLDV